MQPSPPNLNLAPIKPFEKQPFASQLLVFFRVRGRLIILLCQLVVLLSFGGRFILDEQLRSLNQKLNTQMATIQSLSAVETQLGMVQAGLAVVNAAQQNSYDAPGILATFASKIPANVYLQNVSVGRQKIEFNAKTNQPIDFAELVGQLKGTSSFKLVILNSAQFNPDKKEFSIGMTIKL